MSMNQWHPPVWLSVTNTPLKSWENQSISSCKTHNYHLVRCYRETRPPCRYFCFAIPLKHTSRSPEVYHRNASLHAWLNGVPSRSIL